MKYLSIGVCLKLGRSLCHLIHETEIFPMEFVSFHNNGACRGGRWRASLIIQVKTPILKSESFNQVSDFQHVQCIYWQCSQTAAQH